MNTYAEPSVSSTTPRARRWIARIAAICLGLLLAWGVLEIALRIAFDALPTDAQSAIASGVRARGRAAAAGPAIFHNYLVSNPGRGVIWINEPYNNLVVRNNHIVTRTTVTPRTEGLFGLNEGAKIEVLGTEAGKIQRIGMAEKLGLVEAG